MWKVMIIDDEKAIRCLLRITLETVSPGIEIVGEASSGIEAINTIDNYKPDIVFVDIRMPFMDGIEFSKLAIERYPRLKIIILTAFSDFEYARKCIGIGICHYLLKPISREEIKGVMDKVTQKLAEQSTREEDMPEDVYDSGYSVSQIKDFIANNYQDPQVNLTSIAQRFGFNASYLSRMFSHKAGICLNDYLLKCRMEKAVQCAKKGKLMYITATEVGIPDPNYFSKCFKKCTGKVYTEYSKEFSHSGEQENQM